MYDVIINNLPLSELIIVTDRVGLDLAPAGLALAGAEVELVGLPKREYRLALALKPLLERPTTTFSWTARRRWAC